MWRPSDEAGKEDDAPIARQEARVDVPAGGSEEEVGEISEVLTVQETPEPVQGVVTEVVDEVGQEVDVVPVSDILDTYLRRPTPIRLYHPPVRPRVGPRCRRRRGRVGDGPETRNLNRQEDIGSG